ncbi:hypothetical protein ACT691_06145 [Vibrio metschnikovii]
MSRNQGKPARNRLHGYNLPDYSTEKLTTILGNPIPLAEGTLLQICDKKYELDNHKGVNDFHRIITGPMAPTNLYREAHFARQWPLEHVRRNDERHSATAAILKPANSRFLLPITTG